MKTRQATLIAGKRRVCVLVLMIFVVHFLASCTMQKASEKTESGESTTVPNSGNVIQEEKNIQSDPPEPVNEEFLAFLEGKKKFTDFETQKEATIFTLPDIDELYMGTPKMYAVVDIDADGKDELLIEYSVAGDTAILDIDSEVIAYYIPFRGRSELKKDGTMSWSSSASESGVQRIFFSSEGIVDEDTIIYDTQDNIFAVDGESVSKEECERALKKHWEKEDVLWLPINQEFFHGNTGE